MNFKYAVKMCISLLCFCFSAQAMNQDIKCKAAFLDLSVVDNSLSIRGVSKDSHPAVVMLRDKQELRDFQTGFLSKSNSNLVGDVVGMTAKPVAVVRNFGKVKDITVMPPQDVDSFVPTEENIQILLQQFSGYVPSMLYFSGITKSAPVEEAIVYEAQEVENALRGFHYLPGAIVSRRDIKTYGEFLIAKRKLLTESDSISERLRSDRLKILAVEFSTYQLLSNLFETNDLMPAEQRFVYLSLNMSRGMALLSKQLGKEKVDIKSETLRKIFLNSSNKKKQSEDSNHIVYRGQRLDGFEAMAINFTRNYRSAQTSYLRELPFIELVLANDQFKPLVEEFLETYQVVERDPIARWVQKTKNLTGLSKISNTNLRKFVEEFEKAEKFESIEQAFLYTVIYNNRPIPTRFDYRFGQMARYQLQGDFANFLKARGFGSEVALSMLGLVYE